MASGSIIPQVATTDSAIATKTPSYGSGFYWDYPETYFIDEDKAILKTSLFLKHRLESLTARGAECRLCPMYID
jgi:hypothetical protein